MLNKEEKGLLFCIFAATLQTCNSEKLLALLVSKIFLFFRCGNRNTCKVNFNGKMSLEKIFSGFFLNDPNFLTTNTTFRDPNLALSLA